MPFLDTLQWRIYGRGLGGPAPPRPALPFPILGKKKKESQKEEKPAGQATKNRVPP